MRTLVAGRTRVVGGSGRPRRAWRRAVVGASVVTVMAVVGGSTATAGQPATAPTVTALTSFGSGLGSGSTVGPDGALYVTDGNAGRVLRVDPDTGDVTTFAEGLPPQVLGIGGAIDVVFVGHTAYVLVTLVGGDLLLPSGTVHFGDATVGIYRLERDGSFTVLADIGAWSAAHPPATDYFITTGVQYALQRFRGALLVTDGHHNRVLRVSQRGDITPFAVLGNVAPTGLEAAGNTVYVAQAGPIPHLGQDAKVVAIKSPSGRATEVAAGRTGEEVGLTVDVESGRGRQLYALLQGDWDFPIAPENAGLPASPNTGALVEIERDGTYSTVVDGLDRPTSLEVIGDTAFVVTLTGSVIRIDDVSGPPHGRSR